ncbi:hypothetical protein [Pseudoalteromonas xiamenensis]|uniref:Uncharacterized protein n=1 Tax=Pseudoalteromonas xiamenensis TaxID=882626 RepID=A0A975DFF9_9GAMM|nr:hypothetical protein [Pseudoalteromonas xiamenensis]QTH70310.1 hypothetical protein J5O05_09750 [Pseudoalteromonas xiamenensis]
MEFKELLPVIGVAIGWSLSEISSYLRGRGESLKSLGKAISNLYFLNMEMVQIKLAIEKHKNMSSDIKEWERYRQRAFKEYVSKDPEFPVRLNASIDYISEQYPIEGFKLRELVNKYEFMKNKSLEPFLENEKLYVTMLSGYEAGFMGYQYILERSIKSLAKRHSIIEWLKLEFHLRRMKKSNDPKDLVFGSQIVGRKSKKKSNKNIKEDAA